MFCAEILNLRIRNIVQYKVQSKAHPNGGEAVRLQPPPQTPKTEIKNTEFVDNDIRSVK
jgi:hypothetical protein